MEYLKAGKDQNKKPPSSNLKQGVKIKSQINFKGENMSDTKPLEPLEILCSVKGRAFGEEWTEQGQRVRESRWFDVVPAIGESIIEKARHSEVEYTRIK